VYIVSIDESGTPGLRRTDERFYIVAALGIPVDRYRELRDVAVAVYDMLESKGVSVGKELKGSSIHAALRKRYRDEAISHYVELIERVRDELLGFNPFLIAVAINKEDFISLVNSFVIGRIDGVLREPGVEYLNVLRLEVVRTRLLNTVANAAYNIVVKSQVVNEVLYRVNKELENPWLTRTNTI